MSDAGKYYCIVSSSCNKNKATSDTITLIIDDLRITSEPQGAIKQALGNINFTIAAHSSVAINFSYQWYKK